MDINIKVYDGYQRTASGGRTAKPDLNVELDPVIETKSTSRGRSSKNPKAVLASHVSGSKPRIAMFIDVDNVGISRENLLEILFYANGKYQVELCKLYGFSEDTMPGIRDIAMEYNVVTVGKMKFKPTGTNCLDSRILVDAYECAANNRQGIDMIFVWCYPCDLAELFEKIINLGVNTATIENNIFDCKNKCVSQTFKLYSPYNFSFGQQSYGKIQNEPSNIEPSENIEPVTPAEEIPESTMSTVAAEPAQPTPVTEPKPISPATTTETPAPEPEPEPTKPEPVAMPEPTPAPETPAVAPAPEEKPAEKPAEKSEEKPEEKKDDPRMIDGVIPPVLPRRVVLERSGNKPKSEPNPEPTEPTEPAEPAEPNQTENEGDSQPSSVVDEIARKLNLDIPTDEDLAKDSEDIPNPTAGANVYADLLRQVGFGNLVDGSNLKYEDTIGDL